jgi:hypothetical protein
MRSAFASEPAEKSELRIIMTGSTSKHVISCVGGVMLRGKRRGE